MHDDVIERVEFAAVEVADHLPGMVRRLDRHLEQSARLVQGALAAEEDPVAVIDAAIGQGDGGVDDLRGDGGRGQRDLGDGDGGGVGGRVGVDVAGEEELVGPGDVDAGFVGEREGLVLQQQVKLGRWTGDVEEARVVDLECRGQGDVARVDVGEVSGHCNRRNRRLNRLFLSWPRLRGPGRVKSPGENRSRREDVGNGTNAKSIGLRSGRSARWPTHCSHRCCFGSLNLRGFAWCPRERVIVWIEGLELNCVCVWQGFSSLDLRNEDEDVHSVSIDMTSLIDE